MKLFTLNRIRKEDIPEAPSWATKIITPMNNFFESVYNILNKGIDVEYNLTAVYKTINISAADLPYNFTSGLKTKPQSVLLCKILREDNQHAFTSAVFIDWDTDGLGNITLHTITGLDAAYRYNLTLRVE